MEIIGVNDFLICEKAEKSTNEHGIMMISDDKYKNTSLAKIVSLHDCSQYEVDDLVLLDESKSYRINIDSHEYYAIKEDNIIALVKEGK